MTVKGPAAVRRDHDMTAKGPPGARREQRSTKEGLPVARGDRRRRRKGLANERNAARATLSNLLEQLRVYVEGVANENLEFAVSIIESAAMDAVVRSLPNLEPFRVTFDEKTRTARLACKAGPKGCTYYWQMSTDDGETWVDLPPTKQAHTTVRNLVPGQTYWFRYRILRRDGLDDWSGKRYVVAR